MPGSAPGPLWLRFRWALAEPEDAKAVTAAERASGLDTGDGAVFVKLAGIAVGEPLHCHAGTDMTVRLSHEMRLGKGTVDLLPDPTCAGTCISGRGASAIWLLRPPPSVCTRLRLGIVVSIMPQKRTPMRDVTGIAAASLMMRRIFEGEPS